MKYLFDEKLRKGVIKSRPNRFIMMVDVKGKVERCHCPSTGRIGNIKFENVPCLLSRARGDRKTKFTVEAIRAEGKWIGINQIQANRYIEFFLTTNQLSRIINVVQIRREASLGKSRIDFLINNKDYLEVKTPLWEIRIPGAEKSSKELTSFDRIIKHFSDIFSGKKGSRAIFLMCYIYNATRFEVPKKEKSNEKIVKAARKAHKLGLENWQVNLKIDEDGVSLIDYFKLDLF
jgi:sugar fermentation stimulation protein A